MNAVSNTLAARADQDGLRECIRAVLAAAPDAIPAVPPDFSAWMSHLAWLRGELDAGLLESADLEMHERIGLRLLADVAEEVSKMRQCRQCGARSSARFICSCGAKLSQEAAKSGG